MDADALREMLARDPFGPFVIRLSSGEAHEVRDPQCLAIGKGRIAITKRGGASEHVTQCIDGQRSAHILNRCLKAVPSVGTLNDHTNKFLRISSA